jgi:hypothetical protein
MIGLRYERQTTLSDPCGRSSHGILDSGALLTVMDVVDLAMLDSN